VPGTLKVIREGVGIDLRRGTFEIKLDGAVGASIDWGDTIEAPLQPGHHRLQIPARRYCSRPYDFDCADGEVLDFRCHGAMMWSRYVASIVKPDFTVSLHRQ
jgi:hypothetical protein